MFELGLGLVARQAALPFLSSALGLFMAVSDGTTLNSFVKVAEYDVLSKKSVSRALRLWWIDHLKHGLIRIISIGALNLVGGTCTYRALGPRGPLRGVCALGVFFGLLHFTFAPKIAYIIQSMTEESSELGGMTIELQRKWLRMHLVRTLVADVPCFLSFGYVFLKN